jgi:hypothetical protein
MAAAEFNKEAGALDVVPATGRAWATGPSPTIGLSGWIAWLGLAAAAVAQTLYDGSLGTLPHAQGWGYAALPGLAEQRQDGSATRLRTTATPLETAGYARVAPFPLEREPGFNLVLRLRLLAETHVRPDRAGFSVIVLAADRRGVELGFWTNLVFAQNDVPLFTHGEEAAHDFAAGFTDLVLSLRGAQYTLYADGTRLLAGPVRDYTGFSGFPDVYETPSFLFLGDDTTSAAADVVIASVALVPAPRLHFARPGVIEWTGVPGQFYTVETSADLETWTAVSRVLAASDPARFTNAPPGLTPQYLRVTQP